MVLPLLAKLQDSKTDWTVLTEVAWALGKIPDKRAIQPLYDLDKKFQAIRDPDNVTLKKLRKPCSGRSSNATLGISIAKGRRRASLVILLLTERARSECAHLGQKRVSA